MDNNKNYVAGIDFGSSNIVMAVGAVDDKTGLIKVEAMLSRPSSGIEMGWIQNVNDVCDVVRGMKREMEDVLGIRIEEAYAGVSGPFIHYHSYSDHVFTGNGEVVSQSDVDALNDRMARVTVPEEEEVMSRFPLNYIVDHRRETSKPVGAFSRQLSSTFAFIIGKKQPLARLQMVFDASGLRLAGIFANSAIMADAVLTADEKSDGVAVVDIGADTTDVAIYSKGILRYAVTIPMGGRAIDNDINKHGVAIRDVEDLKKECGTAVASAVPENSRITIPGAGKTTRTIIKRNLASIIEARLMDIIDYVKAEIKDSGYESKLPYGLVLTGGTSLIHDIDKLFTAQTEREVRLATAVEGLDGASREKVDSPEYTAAVALLLAGAKKGMCNVDIVEVEVEPDTEESIEVADNSDRKEPAATEHKPFNPETQSSATTYKPVVREVKKPEPPQSRTGVIPPRTVQQTQPVQPEEPKQPAEPAEPVQTTKPEPETPPTPRVPEPVKTKTDKKAEEKKPKKPKTGLFGRIIDSINTMMFQNGEDTDLDEPETKPKENSPVAEGSKGVTVNDLYAEGNASSEADARKRQPARPKLDDDFYVEGSDSEEI